MRNWLVKGKKIRKRKRVVLLVLLLFVVIPDNDGGWCSSYLYSCPFKTPIQMRLSNTEACYFRLCSNKSS